MIRPVAVRTIATVVQKSPWDFRAMPSDSLGTEGTFDDLLKELWGKILPKFAGEEYLEPSPEIRALIVLSTTVAAVLSEDGATMSDRRRRAKVVRPDMYENAVRGMGLAPYFQIIRRILEIDHPDHVRLPAAWPSATSSVRDLGILECRGQREPYLVLNAPYLEKLP